MPGVVHVTHSALRQVDDFIQVVPPERLSQDLNGVSLGSLILSRRAPPPTCRVILNQSPENSSPPVG